MCAGAMEAGASGVTFGRNIFQHRNPPAMVRALYKIIIEGKGTREAILHLDRHKD
jgi:DhnA family fructose-bisphosphate aldolase class Ia